jgi:short-subunit dehydrogenase
MIPSVVWITGASTGIGKEIANEFSKSGHIVIVTGRRKSRLVSIAGEIKFAGREAAALVCNVSSERSVQKTSKKIKELYGRIDVLVNNAGITVFKTFQDTKTTDFDNIIDTNLRGSLLCTKYVLPIMLKKKKGHIINIISVAANTVLENSAVYSASKAGLLAMTNVLREEVRKKNIKISNVLPGPVETPMWDSRSRQMYKNRMLTAQDVAKAVVNIYNQPKKVLIEDIIIRPIKGDI